MRKNELIKVVMIEGWCKNGKGDVEWMGRGEMHGGKWVRSALQHGSGGVVSCCSSGLMAYRYGCT